MDLHREGSFNGSRESTRVYPLSYPIPRKRGELLGLFRFGHASWIKGRVQLRFADDVGAALLLEGPGANLLQAELAHRLSTLERFLGDRCGRVIADQRSQAGDHGKALLDLLLALLAVGFDVERAEIDKGVDARRQELHAFQ